MISLVAAIGKNNELGKENKLLWSLPADMKHFRETTTGHTIIMGRKTFESIGKSLPNRRNIIITRNKNFQQKGEIEKIEIVNSFQEAIALSTSTLSRQGLDSVQALPGHEIFVIGGGEIYKQAINLADKLYITHIKAEDKEADSFFPVIDSSIWKETNKEEHSKDEKNEYSYSFVTYDKIIK